MKKNKLFQYTIPELRKKVKTALQVNDSSDYEIDKELKNHSEEHADWIFLFGEAKRLHRLAELELQQITARVSAEIRENANPPLPKTAPVMKEMVPLNSEWKEANRKVIELEEFALILESLCKNWNNRAYLLTKLADRRTETREVRTFDKKKMKELELEEYDL